MNTEAPSVPLEGRPGQGPSREPLREDLVEHRVIPLHGRHVTPRHTEIKAVAPHRRSHAIPDLLWPGRAGNSSSKHTLIRVKAGTVLGLIGRATRSGSGQKSRARALQEGDGRATGYPGSSGRAVRHGWVRPAIQHREERGCERQIRHHVAKGSGRRSGTPTPGSSR